MQERSGGSWIEASLGKIVQRLYVEKTHHRKGMEWLNV
jgi:hypothetical protein